jgi:hypothetical protein
MADGIPDQPRPGAAPAVSVSWIAKLSDMGEG